MSAYSFDYPRAHGLPRPRAGFRAVPEDFLVEEVLGFSLTGHGEHLWLFVEKTGLNTMDVVSALARASGQRQQDIGYAGLKDRQAVTRQWFSLRRDADLDPASLADARIRIIEQAHNTRKLQRGSHRGNRFVITLRDLAGVTDSLEAGVALVMEKGVPNYFGPQRFGHAGNNVANAEALFGGTLHKVPRYKRGIYLSAARAFLFNDLLARRVDAGNWDRELEGDVMALAGSSSVFQAEHGDAALAERLAALDIHPTGPLWGHGQPMTSAQSEALEQAVAGAHPVLSAGLATAGMKQERRPLRLVPESAGLSAGNGQVVIEFSLARGAFATSVLRELVEAQGL